jgi:hypothetical protein
MLYLLIHVIVLIILQEVSCVVYLIHDPQFM